MAINHVAIEGRLTKDPELRYTASGIAQATFGIAQNQRKKVGNEWVDGDTSFFDVVCWRDLAENTAELAQGQSVVVVGRLQQRSWEHEGQKRSKVEIVAEDVMLSRRWAPRDGARSEPVTRDYSDDEAPF